MRFRFRLFIVAAALASHGVVHAQGQAYPTRLIRMVVTSAPGSSPDVMARIVADQVSRTIGQSMIVENRLGAGGNIGVAFVAKSAPDGYTLVLTTVGPITISRWVTKEMLFDPLNDVIAVAPVAELPNVIAIYDKIPARDLKEFIAYAKNNPGKIDYGSAGNGTILHLAAEMFGQFTGISMTHIPYKGGGPAAIDLGAGRIHLAFLGTASMQAQLAAGQVRALAVASKQRLAALPSVPTFEQAGLTGFDVTNWFGVLAPRGTPREIVQKLNNHIGQVFDHPAVIERFTAGGMLPMKESPEDFQKRIIADDKKWRDIVRSAGIKPE